MNRKNSKLKRPPCQHLMSYRAILNMIHGFKRFVILEPMYMANVIESDQFIIPNAIQSGRYQNYCSASDLH